MFLLMASNCFSDTCLSTLITCDTGLAWSLRKFKSTIIKQKDNKKCAKRRLGNAIALPRISSGFPLPISASHKDTFALLWIRNLRTSELSWLFRKAKSIPVVPLRASPFTVPASCSDVKLYSHTTEPLLSAILPLCNPGVSLKIAEIQTKITWKITEKTADKIRGDMVELITLNLFPYLTSAQVYSSTLHRYKIESMHTCH